MALAHSALSSFFPSSATNTLITRKTLAFGSSPTPSKFTKRKNHLRPKLLKTLIKPSFNPLFPQETLENPKNLSETLEIPQEEELEISSDRFLGDFSGDLAREDENDEQRELVLRELRVSETAGAEVSDAPGVVSTRSVLKLMMYLVGLFVFQTVCAVWVFGSGNFDKKSGNVEGEAELGISGSDAANGKKKGGFLLNRSSEVLRNSFGSKHGGVIDVDKSEVEEKIVEIRAMAREARESEAKKLSTNDLLSSSDIIGVDGNETVPKTEIARVKTNIQKEVDGRLSKLEKKLHSLREKSPVSSVSYLSSSGKGKDKKDLESSDAKVKPEKLVFRKKLKFRSPSTNPGNNPKGFGAKDYSMANGNSRTATPDTSFRSGSNGSDALDLSAREQPIDLPNGDPQESMTMEEEESHWLTVDTSKESASKVQENEEASRDLSSNELSSFQALGTKLEKEGGILEMGMGKRAENAKPRSGGIQEISRELVEPRESSELKTKLSQSFAKEVEHKPKVNKLRDKRVDSKKDLWWKNLPYALAIIVRRGSDREGPRGLYKLKIYEGSSSYTVAFEDRQDASNFCYILESFFEELGDFSADVVPLSIKELDEAVKSRTMKMIVVRKGQLRLYAGQPLADVEMALRSLVM